MRGDFIEAIKHYYGTLPPPPQCYYSEGELTTNLIRHKSRNNYHQFRQRTDVYTMQRHSNPKVSLGTCSLGLREWRPASLLNGKSY